MRTHYTHSGGVDRTEFFRTFPFAKYLQQVKFTDLPALQADREFVWQQFGDGDEFLYRLGDAYLRLYPITPPHIEHGLNVGEVFLSAAGDRITVRNREPYHIIGYFVLNHVARRIEREHSAGRFDPSVPRNAQIVARLARNKVHLAFEESAVNKVLTNVRKGNFAYIRDRVINRVLQLWDRLGAPAPRPGPALTAYSAVPYRSYLRGRHGYEYRILQVHDAGRQPIGFAAFTHRPHVRVQYVATDVQRRFAAARQRGGLLIAATGGFTNNYRKPEGLSVERGTIVNAVLMPDRHGLVLVQADGGMRVLNLRRDQVVLPLRNGRTLTIRHPLTSLLDFSRLLNWCRTEKVTAFQTQLMVFSDSLLLDPARASGKLAERRMLALVRARASGDVFLAVFNLPTKQSLYEASAGIFGFLRANHYKVEALLNLDTGGQDVFWLYDDRGDNVRDQAGRAIRGQRTSAETTSLLLFFKP